MQNVEVKIDKGTMTIKVDLSKNFGSSKSGKTQIIASTQGNQTFQNGDKSVTLGLNVYTKE